MDAEPKYYDVAILGAGPAGLVAACECARQGLSCLVVDRGGLAQSFTEYPRALRFFSPAIEMEIDGVPLSVAGGEKPDLQTYLSYLRGVARARSIPLATWEEVTAFEKRPDGLFRLDTRKRPNAEPGRTVHARFVILAIGIWSEPAQLPCAGFESPHVLSEFDEPTAFYGHPVLVVGGGNSAVGAALSLMEAGASVSLSMRRPPKDYRSGLRPFVRRDLGFAVDEQKIRLLDETIVTEIASESAVLQPVRYTGDEDLSEGKATEYEAVGASFRIPCRFVFSLIGHRPDTRFLEKTLGLTLQADGRPVCNLQSWETQCPAMYAAGSLADQSIDIVLRLRDQAKSVVRTIAEKSNKRVKKHGTH
ncbi:MAG: NAD(P)-binding domain-containing protein [Candidatus Sumerlaeota bacterium]